MVQFEDSSDSENEAILQEIEETKSTSTSESSDEEKTLEQTPIDRKIGEFVVFSYEKTMYPGIITNVSETGATISAMAKCGRLWKWPDREDKLEYEWKAILFHINEPVKMSKTRNVYLVKELDKWN